MISLSSLQRGMIVVPVVGILSDKKAFVPAPNASEVEAVFDTPLEMFLKVSLSQSSSQSIYYASCMSHDIYSMMMDFRMRTGEQRRENGWETSIYSITSIMKQRMRGM